MQWKIAYAQYVEIDSPDCDFVLSDNYFDMNAGLIYQKKGDCL